MSITTKGERAVRIRDKIISFMLAFTIIITSVAWVTPSYAEGMKDNDNKGSGDGNTANVSGGTWSTYNSGYRFTIVDADLIQVSNSVDIVFKELQADVKLSVDRNRQYKLSRAKNPSAEGYARYTWDTIFNSPHFLSVSAKDREYPPLPIAYANGKATSQGEIK